MKLIWNIGWMLCSGIMIFACAEHVLLATKNFQLNFLSAIEEIVQNETKLYLDELLNALSAQQSYNAYELELKSAKEALQVQTKVVYIKQLLDVGTSELNSEQQFNIMRNINFFKKLKQKLKKFEEESMQEMRELRMFRVCRQFQNQTNNTSTTNAQNKKFYPYSRATQLVPINEQNIGNALEHLDAKANHTVTVDLKEFGNSLYESIKAEGAEIIDDYLHSIRQLLQDVLDESADDAEQYFVDKINKVVGEIDAILNVSDFFEKRQKLYAYLETGLTMDYEDFHKSEHEFADIFMKLNERGMNLFVAFLFSNFQFLEHLHEQWHKLLPVAPVGLYDEQTKQLHDIHHHYKQFKINEERRDAYDTYMQHVDALHAKTNVRAGNGDASSAVPDLSDGHTRIFEVLRNSSQNLGRVTLNIIRERCEEFNVK